MLFNPVYSTTYYDTLNMKPNANITFSGGKILNSTNGTDQTDLMTIGQGWDKINDSGDSMRGVLYVVNGTGQAAVSYAQTIGADKKFNVLNYGATGNGITDDADNIQAAIDAAGAAGGGEVVIPAGNYSLATRQTTGDAGTHGVILHPHSGVRITGAGIGVTRLRVANGLRTSSLSCPILYDYSTSRIENWSVSGITFDGNAQNNRLLGGWTSTWDAIGARRARNVIIENNQFVNITGMWCLVLGAYSDDPLCTGAIVRNNLVSNVCTAAIDDRIADFTAFYIAVDNLMMTGNVFVPVILVGTNGNAAAMEFHAENGEISGNFVKNFGNGMYICADGIRTAQSSTKVHHNSFLINKTGIGIWGAPGKAYNVLEVADNTIQYQTPFLVGESAIYHMNSPVSQNNGMQTRQLILRGNTVIGTSTAYPKYGIDVNQVKSVVVEANKLYNITGYSVYLHLSNTTKNVFVKDNVLAGYGFSADQKCGIVVTTTVAQPQITFSGNDLYNLTDANQPNVGIYVSVQNGVVVNVVSDNNIVVGAKYFPFYMDGSINAASAVRAVTQSTSVDTSGFWGAGSITWNTAPAAGGAPGWVCTTGGAPPTWKTMANLSA